MVPIFDHPDGADHEFYELCPSLEDVGSLFAAHMSSADREEVSFPTTVLDEAIARRDPRDRNLSGSIRRAFRERVSAAYKVARDTCESPPRYVEVCRASGEVDESEGGSHGTMR